MFDYTKNFVPAFDKDAYLKQLEQMSEAYFKGAEQVLKAQREAFDKGMEFVNSTTKEK